MANQKPRKLKDLPWFIRKLPRRPRHRVVRFVYFRHPPVMEPYTRKVIRCPKCGNPRIAKTYMFGQSSYSCYVCNEWSPWNEREIVYNPNYVRPPKLKSKRRKTRRSK